MITIPKATKIESYIALAVICLCLASGCTPLCAAAVQAMPAGVEALYMAMEGLLFGYIARRGLAGRSFGFSEKKFRFV